MNGAGAAGVTNNRVVDTSEGDFRTVRVQFQAAEAMNGAGAADVTNNRVVDTSEDHELASSESTNKSPVKLDLFSYYLARSYTLNGIPQVVCIQTLPTDEEPLVSVNILQPSKTKSRKGIQRFSTDDPAPDEIEKEDIKVRISITNFTRYKNGDIGFYSWAKRLIDFNMSIATERAATDLAWREFVAKKDVEDSLKKEASEPFRRSNRLRVPNVRHKEINVDDRRREKYGSKVAFQQTQGVVPTALPISSIVTPSLGQETATEKLPSSQGAIRRTHVTPMISQLSQRAVNIKLSNMLPSSPIQSQGAMPTPLPISSIVTLSLDQETASQKSPSSPGDSEQNRGTVPPASPISSIVTPSLGQETATEKLPSSQGAIRRTQVTPMISQLSQRAVNIKLSNMLSSSPIQSQGAVPTPLPISSIVTLSLDQETASPKSPSSPGDSEQNRGTVPPASPISIVKPTHQSSIVFSLLNEVVVNHEIPSTSSAAVLQQELNTSRNSEVSNYSSPDASLDINNQPTRKSRSDREWIKIADYESYEAAIADVKAEKIWSVSSSDDYTVTFRCNKVKAKSEQCQSGLKVTFNEYDLGVALFASGKPHNCDTLEKSHNKMTDQARQFIQTQFEHGFKAKAIQDALIAANIPLPPKYLISNEIQRLRRLKQETTAFKVSELNTLLEDHRKVPDEELAAYVLDFQIIDDDDDDDDGDVGIKFNFVVSSKKLLRNNMTSAVCNADSTYKLIWQGFPVQVVGFTDGNKKFHPNSISVSTKEREEDFRFIFNALKEGTITALNQDWKPKVIMSDAAKGIPNSFRQIFGDDIIELMCWFHAKCAMKDNVANLIPKEKQSEIIVDIDMLQLSQSPEMFDKASTLFLEKYAAYQHFVDYFKEEWIHQHKNWYEGACVGIGTKAPSCNNGLEVFNRTIKDEKTLRKRLPLQTFFNQLLVWIHSWGARYVGGANEVLTHPLVDLPLMTKAYQWKKESKIIKYHSNGFIMVPAGKDTDLSNWNKCLLDWNTFDEFKANAFSGWSTIVPETWIEGSCTCPMYLKDYICKHIVGIAIRRKLLEVPITAKQIPIGQKRKRGRPKLAKKALVRD